MCLALASAATGEHLPAAAEPVHAGSSVWILLVLIPLAFAVLSRPAARVLRVKDDARASFFGWWAAAACAAVFSCLLLFWLGGAAQGTFELHGFVGYGLRLAVSPASLLFSLFASWLWLLAALFSRGYLAHGHAHARYYFYFLLCLAGTLGTFLAGNLLTLFIFFEMVSLGAYPLVAHEETEEALSAGRLYLFISVVGGLSVFFGTALMQGLRGTTDLTAFADPAHTAYWLTVACLLLFGFSVKAGLVPVHIWLPRAHPVAPSPASALLSGVMIKTGAWGIYQVIRLFASPVAHDAPHAVPHAANGALASASGAAYIASPVTEQVAGHAAEAVDIASRIGYALVPLALVTMFLGAAMALFATNAKRVLAYSSVSQIGYVVLGAALAGVLGSGEGMAAAGFAFHALAHALFKATMFLLVGVIYLKTHDLDIRKLGPLIKRMPVTAAVFAVAVLGIVGFPGFSGYPSKTVLHDAILLLRHDPGGPAWGLVEGLFILTSALTVAYMSKLWYFLFLRRPGRRPAAVARGSSHGEEGAHSPHDRPVAETWGERLLMGLAVLPMLAIGLGFGTVLPKLILPFVHATGYAHDALHHVEHLSFFAANTLTSGAIPLVGGVVVFSVLARIGFPGPIRDRMPSVEGMLIRPLVSGLMLVMRVAAGFDRLINGVYLGAVRFGARLTGLFAWADRVENEALVTGARQAGNLVKAAAAADHMVDEALITGARQAGNLVKAATAADQMVDEGITGTARAGASLARALTAVDTGIDEGILGSARASSDVVRELTAVDRAMETRFDEMTTRVAAPLNPVDEDQAAAADAVSEQVEGGLGARVGELLAKARASVSLHNLNVAALLLAAMVALMVLAFILWPGRAQR